MFDLTVLPIAIMAGKEGIALPGFGASLPPRQAARGHTTDRLSLFMTFPAKASLSVDVQSQIIAHLSQTYYKTHGSVTYSMRLVADVLNQYLLKRNTSDAGSQRQVLGSLSLVVARDRMLYLAHSGSNQAFLLRDDGLLELYDKQTIGRGLGGSRTVTQRYFQTEVLPGDILLVCSQLPVDWPVSVLTTGGAATLDLLRRRLLGQGAFDLHAILIQFQEGTGKLITLRPKELMSASEEQPKTSGKLPALDPKKTPATAPERESVIHAGQAPSSRASSVAGMERPETHKPDKLKAAASRPVRQPGATPSVSVRPADGGTGPVVTPRVQNPGPPSPTGQPISLTPSFTPYDSAGAAPSKFRMASNKFLKGVAEVLRGTMPFGQAIKAGLVWISNQLRLLISRMLPEAADSPFTFSPLVMAIVAIAVPLIVVTIASVVYLQRGRVAQYEGYFSQAQGAAVGTLNQPDQKQVRDAWEKTLYWLDMAEGYQVTSESQALRKQAQTALDELDGILRLGFAQAIAGGLSGSINVTKMVASTSDLYLLNASRGNVMRAILTGRGYEIDPTFACDAGTYENVVMGYASVTVGQIVDMIMLPTGNSLDAAILGIDKAGNLIYCKPGNTPKSGALAQPESPWQTIKVLVLDGVELYVLDTQANAVWRYSDGDYLFPDRPTLYLYKIRPDVKEVVDMAANDGDLYLLHQDGHLIKCIPGSVEGAQSRCLNPAPFVTPMLGDTVGKATLPDTHFTRLVLTQPPDPSVYFLEPSTQAIYQFSWQLSLHTQLRLQPGQANDLRGLTATAIAFSPNRTVFMALKNQVYYAILP